MEFLFAFTLLSVIGLSAQVSSQFVEISGSDKHFMVDGIYEKQEYGFIHTDGRKILHNQDGHWQIGSGDNLFGAFDNTWYRNTVNSTDTTIPPNAWELVSVVRIQSAGNDVKGLHVSVIESDINKTTIFSDENIKLDNRVSQKNFFF